MRIQTLNSNKLILISQGEADSIAPEITFKALNEFAGSDSSLLICDYSKIKVHADLWLKKDYTVINSVGQRTEGCINVLDMGESGIEDAQSFLFVDKAVDIALENDNCALVTAPISKERWDKNNYLYKGHTDFLAEKSGVKDYSMFFWSDSLKVSLFTVHIPLKDIFKEIKKDKIVSFVKDLNIELKRKFRKDFTIYLNGLNPHASESGLLGKEETEQIIPAKKELEDCGIKVEGPYPPDVMFLKALKDKDAVVVSWYHDQGLIPFKLLNINEGVNVTLGLPFVRTSPDHGTAFDIAGKGIADPSSMLQALKLACKLA